MSGCRVLRGMVGPEREEGSGGWTVMQNGLGLNNSTNIEMIWSMNDQVGGSRSKLGAVRNAKIVLNGEYEDIKKLGLSRNTREGSNKT